MAQETRRSAAAFHQRGSVMSFFAGLYDRWKDPETQEPVISCTIIVTDPDELTPPIHDRKPGAPEGGHRAMAEWRPVRNRQGQPLKIGFACRGLSRRVNKTATADDGLTLLDDVAA